MANVQVTHHKRGKIGHETTIKIRIAGKIELRDIIQSAREFGEQFEDENVKKQIHPDPMPNPNQTEIEQLKAHQIQLQAQNDDIQSQLNQILQFFQGQADQETNHGKTKGKKAKD